MRSLVEWVKRTDQLEEECAWRKRIMVGLWEEGNTQQIKIDELQAVVARLTHEVDVLESGVAKLGGATLRSEGELLGVAYDVEVGKKPAFNDIHTLSNKKVKQGEK